MNNPKLFIHGRLQFITFRAEQGLPLPAEIFIVSILLGIFGSAQTKYKVTACGLLVMANHVHMAIVVEDPSDVPQFVRYVKSQSAHAINLIDGFEKRTVWCEGYDSPEIKDAQSAIDKFVYMYSNPVNANLVEKIEDYPHINSWRAFLKGGSSICCVRIPNSCILPFDSSKKTPEEIAEYNAKLLENANEEYEFVIEPDAWHKCFPETEDADPALIRDEIIRRVRENEARALRERTKPVLGSEKLKHETPRKNYIPKKRGQRTICIAKDKKVRGQYIEWFKEHTALARKAYQEWKLGNRQANYPPGFFAPGGLLIANLVPALAP